jgi:glutamine amidotransferase
MCELFAMSSRHPATVSLSLDEFSRHGGQTAGHKDGWGIVWYDDGDARQIKEAEPAAQSACVRFLQAHPFRSSVVLSHIRKATQGAVATRNCQPFIRELGGVWHSFAHNGHLAGLVDNPHLAGGAFRPVGETDSELAFCALLARLAPLWHGTERPSLAARREVVERFAAELRAHGPANFLYSDGDALFAHAHRRTQADGTVSPPGLWRLARHCEAGGTLRAEGLGIEAHGAAQDVALVASVPLTDEHWVPLAEGTLLVAQQGALA